MPGTHAHTDSPPNMPVGGGAFVRTEFSEARPAPVATSGAVGWMRENLFSGWPNILMTLLGLYLLWVIVPPLVDFLLLDAVWSGENRRACATEAQGGVQPNGWFGACWPYVGAYFDQFVYGRYPMDERWRVNVTFVLLALALVPLLWPDAPYKRLGLIYAGVLFPLLAFILLSGGDMDYDGFFGAGYGESGFAIGYVLFSLLVVGIAAGWGKLTSGQWLGPARTAIIAMAGLGVVLVLLSFDWGLEAVETDVWGGLLVTLVIAVTGIAASLPLGILLALGRRSNMPAVRLLCIAFIEFWRGVPLITVLFMSSVMLPLFLPDGVTFDKLLRALIGVALFSAAYMAEVVRGGLQAIPKGQYEGAMAMGLTYWQMMRMIILPQALTLVIPGIVNTFIGLFKDTTLVLIIGLFDFLGMIQSSFSDSTWATPVQLLTAYSFAALVYWLFCFGMSRYSIYTERRLDTGHRS